MGTRVKGTRVVANDLFLKISVLSKNQVVFKNQAILKNIRI